MAASASPAWMASASALDAAAEAVDACAARRCRRRPATSSRAERCPSTVDPVASSTAALTAALMRGCSAAGPTMSPSTAPASTEVSWPGSPTRTSRASRPDGLGEPRHQRQRHHRGLVDDHDVVGQPVAAVVAEAAVGAGLPAEQAVERRGLELEQPRADRRRRRRAARPRRGPPPPAARRPCRSGRRGRRAAVRRPRRAPAPRAARRSGRRWSSCRCPGRRRRPRGGAGPPRRPPASAGRRAPRRRTAGRARRRARPCRRCRRGRRRAPRGRRRPAAPRASSGRGRARCRRAAAGGPAPPASLAPRAGWPRRHPAGESGQGSVGEVDGLVDVDRRRLADALEVDEHVPDARRAHGERGSQQHGLVGSRRRARRAAARRGRRRPPARRRR